LLLAGFGQPAHGTVTQNADNTLRYQPAADFAGADAFTYTISDLSGITDEGEVQVTVRPVNDAPVLDPIAKSAVAEGNELTFRATATDIDSAALSFSLGAGAPAGAAIDPATGVFTWRPTEAQGPGQYEIAIIVTDDGVPARTDTRPFSVTVTEVNTAPTLESIADKTINPGEEFSLQCVGTDADLPANVLSFGVTGPAGATIEPFGGVVHWRPGVALANTTNQFVVTVTDNGAPPLEASRTFNVIVGPLAEATLTAVGITGAHFQLQIDGTVGPEYTIQASTDLAAWADVVKTNISSSPCQVTIPDPAGTGYRFFRALLGP
jgi:hypothetical protein